MSASNGTHEPKIYAPSEAAVRSAHVSGMAAYEALVKEAQADHEAFHHGERVHGRHHVVDGLHGVAGAHGTHVENVRTDRPQHRFLFQMHPHPLSTRRILTEELERYPWARASLLREEELGASGLRFEELCSEPQLANGWVAASTFTARSLAENGVPLEQIHVIPYGVEAALFPERAAPPPRGRRLRVLFVGSAIQRKGLCDLFEAIRRVGPEHVELTLAGRGYIDRELIEHYADTNPTIVRDLSGPALSRLMHESDLFALPSLVEGFGHVVIEAMSSGLPVLASTNTCAVDLVEDGVQGWIVPIRAPDAIAERLTQALAGREQLEAMGRAAAERARSLSWPLFRERIANAYQAMLERRGPDKFNG